MIQAGKKLPAFSLPDQDGTTRTAKDFLGAWWVLYAYPKDLTPGCTTEAIDFTALKKSFAKLGAQVVGISPDTPKKHCSFIDKKDLQLILLSDTEHSLLEALGFWGLKKFMGREYMGVLRSTLLINPEGKVAEVWSPVSVAGHAQAVLDRLKELA